MRSSVLCSGGSQHVRSTWVMLIDNQPEIGPLSVDGPHGDRILFCRISESLYAHSGANWSMEKQCDAYAEAIAFATRVWAGNAEAAGWCNTATVCHTSCPSSFPSKVVILETSLFFARRSGGAARPVSFSPTMPSRDLRFPAGRERSLESQTTRLPIYRSRMRPASTSVWQREVFEPESTANSRRPHNFIQSPLSLTRRVVEDSPSLSSWKSRMEAEVSGDTVTQGSLWASPASPVHSPPNPMIPPAEGWKTARFARVPWTEANSSSSSLRPAIASASGCGGGVAFGLAFFQPCTQRLPCTARLERRL